MYVPVGHGYPKPSKQYSPVEEKEVTHKRGMSHGHNSVGTGSAHDKLSEATPHIHTHTQPNNHSHIHDPHANPQTFPQKCARIPAGQGTPDAEVLRLPHRTPSPQRPEQVEEFWPGDAPKKLRGQGMGRTRSRPNPSHTKEGARTQSPQDMVGQMPVDTKLRVNRNTWLAGSRRGGAEGKGRRGEGGGKRVRTQVGSHRPHRLRGSTGQQGTVPGHCAHQ